MKKLLLINMLLVLFMGAKAYDFPLSDFGILYEFHTEVEIEYTEGDEFVLVTYKPEAPWMTQAGWGFDSNPKDFNGFTHLLIDFESVSANGNFEFSVESTVEVDGKKTLSKSVPPTAKSAVIDLRAFTPEQLASIEKVSNMVWDPDDATAVFKVKGASLVNDDSYFPLFALGALHGNTALDVNYQHEQGLVEITYLPADPWASQSGWDFKNNNADFTGYTHLIVNVDPISVNADFELIVESSQEFNAIKEVKNRAPQTANQLIVNLSQFHEQQLKAIERVSIWVWDQNYETARFNVKGAYLVNIEESDFSLIDIQPLYGHTAVITELQEDLSMQITFLPSLFYEAQVGWEYEESKNFSDYGVLIAEFDNVDTDAEIILGATSVNDNFIEVKAELVDNKISLDLYQFTKEEAMAVKRVYLMIDDEETETAKVRLKSVTLKEADGDFISSIKNVEIDVNVDVYTITGVKIRENIRRSEALLGLPRGLYIVGNEKVYIK